MSTQVGTGVPSSNSDGAKRVSRRRRVFLGSSTATREHLDTIGAWLEEEGLHSVPWQDPEVFLPGSVGLYRLINIARSEVGAAVFVFSEDHFNTTTNGTTAGSNDNVLLEYGIFLSALGPDHVISVGVGTPARPTDADGVTYVNLDRPQQAKQAIKKWAQQVRASHVASSGGQLFDTYVDAALYTETTGAARAEILKCAKSSGLIPGRYLYDNDVGTDYWTRLCGDTAYKYFQRGLRFWGKKAPAFVAKIKEVVGPEFDFVSLGPGDGRKDLELIRAWMNDDELDIIYYPYDVSLTMISHAVREIRNIGQPLRIRAVLADFEDLKHMHTVFAARDAPNVVSLLGNSLGNVPDELHFVRKLRALMSADDLLLLEVRLTGKNAEPAEVQARKAKQFYFGPLENYLALKLDESKLKTESRDDLSAIGDTRSTIVYYKDFTFEGEKYEDTRLIYIHEYERATFLSTMAEAGFECIMEEVDSTGGFLVCLLKPCTPAKAQIGFP